MSLEKCLIRSSAQFLTWLFAVLMLNCMSYFLFLEINPLSIASFAIIFTHSEKNALLLSALSKRDSYRILFDKRSLVKWEELREGWVGILALPFTSSLMGIFPSLFKP